MEFMKTIFCFLLLLIYTQQVKVRTVAVVTFLSPATLYKGLQWNLPEHAVILLKLEVQSKSRLL